MFFFSITNACGIVFSQILTRSDRIVFEEYTNKVKRYIGRTKINNITHEQYLHLKEIFIDQLDWNEEVDYMSSIKIKIRETLSNYLSATHFRQRVEVGGNNVNAKPKKHNKTKKRQLIKKFKRKKKLTKR